MSWETYYEYPIAFRKWLIERINKEVSRAVDNKADIPSKGLQHNTPQMRAMTGKTKQFGQNGKTQRFT
jgi:hypothetical protein